MTIPGPFFFEDRAHSQDSMREDQVIGIETALGIRLPSEYRNFVFSPQLQERPEAFSDPLEAIVVNQTCRAMCWLGRPLENAFYVFGRSEAGWELMLDIDVPGIPVMVADYERQAGKVVARSFTDWLAGKFLPAY